MAKRAPTRPHAAHSEAKICGKASIKSGRALEYTILAATPSINPMSPITKRVKAIFDLWPIKTPPQYIF